MPRSMASGDSSFMSPPPWPRRTTSFSRVSVSKRSPPTGRATTRWKLFVPMSRAASTGRSTCSSGVVTMSASDLRRAGLQPVQHTFAEAGDLLEAAAERRRRSTPSSPIDERGLDRLVEVAGLDAAPARRWRRPSSSGTIDCAQRAGQAVVDRGAAASPSSGLPSGELGGLAPRPAEDVADDEVAEAVVEVPGERLVEEDLVASPGTARRRCRTSPPGSSHVDLVGRLRPARRVSAGTVDALRPASAVDQKTLRSAVMNPTISLVAVAERRVAVAAVGRPEDVRARAAAGRRSARRSGRRPR